MKKKLDFARPDFIFGIVWAITFFLNTIIHSIYTVPFNSKVAALIGTNIFSFIFLYYFLKKCYGIKDAVETTYLKPNELNKLKKIALWLGFFWLVGFIVNVIFSQGVPIYWRYIGDPKTYVNFGVPTFSGLLNTIRLFVSVSLTVYLFHKFSFKILFILLLLIVSCLAEMSRGNFTFLLLAVTGVIFLYTQINLKRLAFVVLGMFLFLALFGYVGSLREKTGDISSIIENKSFAKSMPATFVWGYAYLTSPLNNLNYGAEWVQPNFKPVNTLVTLVPTVAREALFGPVDYPIYFVDASLNATTFYSPLVADFGFGFACLIVVVMQFVIVTVYLKAKQGHTRAVLAYPILYSCLILCIFYMYFFTLVVFLYLFLAAMFSFFKETNPMNNEA